MNTKIYAFILGLVLSTGVFALVSFKHEEKDIEKEQMIIIAKGNPRHYELFISTALKYERTNYETKDYMSYVSLLSKIKEYQKEGWNIISSNHSNSQALDNYFLYFQLEK